eukprot:1158563-Pelagomonas_calceolata.AAC.3
MEKTKLTMHADPALGQLLPCPQNGSCSQKAQASKQASKQVSEQLTSFRVSAAVARLSCGRMAQSGLAFW